MSSKLAVAILNQLINANPQLNPELKKVSGKAIELLVLGVMIRFMVHDAGVAFAGNVVPDVVIHIPLAAGSYLIDQNQLNTFSKIKIEGDQKLGQDWLKIMSGLRVNNILYQHDSVILGMLAVKFERVLINMINYLKLVIDNASLSTSQYLQYESNSIVGKYEIEKFCSEVDEINSRYQILMKRVERLRKAL